MLFCNRKLETIGGSLMPRKERTSHGKMPCPFCVSDDFAEISRVVDVGRVAKIIAE